MRGLFADGCYAIYHLTRTDEGKAIVFQAHSTIGTTALATIANVVVNDENRDAVMWGRVVAERFASEALLVATKEKVGGLQAKVGELEGELQAASEENAAAALKPAEPESTTALKLAESEETVGSLREELREALSRVVIVEE